MHLDENGLPAQVDGNVNDQLQRASMIVTAGALTPLPPEMGGVYLTCRIAIERDLQPEPGVYVRYIGGDADNVSADQLIAALAAHVANRNGTMVKRMLLTCLKRWGFAQNKKDGLDGTARRKTPDFMLFRALPLFARAHWSLYPVTVLADLLLVLLSLSAVGPVWKDDSLIPQRRSPDDVDHNGTIVTLAACRSRMVTPLSWLALKLFARLCPESYGNTVLGERNNVQAGLAWYHRAESGGNPEIAELWRPIIDRYFGGSQ